MGFKKPTQAESRVSGQANKLLSKPPHSLSIEQLIGELKADSQDGLKTNDAEARLIEYGANELGEDEGVQPIKILLTQVANAMTLVLLLAMAVSFGIQSYIEGGVITFVIILNVTIGYRQEYYAQKTMDSLRSLSSPTANAVRDGKSISIATRHVVPGDMVELKTGDTVPADLRLIEAVNLETDEALLTGESLPVAKKANELFLEDTGPGDRLNVTYSPSTVTKGRARGIIFATGMFTRYSVIRTSNGRAGPHRYVEAWSKTFGYAVGRFLGINVGTPLQKKLARLALLLFGIAVVFAIVVLAANRFANFANRSSSNEVSSTP